MTLEQVGLITVIITQNVDILHQRAGSRNVITLHGSFDRVICLECGAVISLESLDVRLTVLNADFLVLLGDIDEIEIIPEVDAVISQTAGFQVAACEQSGGMLKPDVMYFGEGTEGG